jgi:hypothetical protein
MDEFQKQINVVGIGVFLTTYAVTQSLRDALIVGLVHGGLHYLVGHVDEIPSPTRRTVTSTQPFGTYTY